MNTVWYRRVFWWMWIAYLHLYYLSLLLVWWLNEGTVVTGTSRWELEAVDSEWKVLIIWIVDQESVVDALLEALGLVAFWDEWASGSWSSAFLDTGGLGEGFVVSLDVVNDDPPLAVDVDSTEWLDVGSLGWAQVGLLDDLLQAGNRVVGVGQDILVHLLDGVVVVFDSLLDFVGWVFGVFQAEWFWVTLGALWWAIVGFVVWGRVMGSWVVGSWVMGSWVVGGWVMGNWVVGSWVVWLRVVWLWVVRFWVIRLWVVRSSWGVRSWLMVRSWGGGVPVHWWGGGVTVSWGGSVTCSGHDKGRNHL